MATNPEQSFSVEHDDEGPDHVMTVAGEVDIYAATRFEAELAKGYAAQGRMIVDLRKCRYIDSSAISTLTRANRQSRGKLHLVVDGECKVKRILDVTQIEKIVPVHSSVEDARS
ncbi:MAG: STAS domain-containing protein [Vulcanimicrobiaceae bacterium]